jgi:hypothetical protein
MSKDWDKEVEKQVEELKVKAPDYDAAWKDLRESINSNS